VAVNGKAAVLGTKLDPDTDKVTIDGRPVVGKSPPRVYWMLHKPDEVLTSRYDEFQRKTIYDLPMVKKATFLVSPVGRLDYRTEGLLLLTNDGELANRLTNPKYHVPRTYHVLITGKLTPDEEKAIKSGVTLEDGKVGQTELRYAHGRNLGASRGSWYVVTVYEGRNRLVRRIFEHFDHKVVRLLRVAFGDLHLPEELKPGEYRQLTSEQIHELKKAARLT